jgi:hypothetical protein
VIMAASVLYFCFIYLALLSTSFLILLWVSATLARISSAVAVQLNGMASVFQWVIRNGSHLMLGS